VLELTQLKELIGHPTQNIDTYDVEKMHKTLHSCLESSFETVDPSF
jgi:hypothetical protein